jgi:hypothetical protein
MPKSQGLQHGGKPRMVTIMFISASILNYHLLCVLCSHIEKESTSILFMSPFFEEIPLIW